MADYLGNAQTIVQFVENLKNKSNDVKGKLFEKFAEDFFRVSPRYAPGLEKVYSTNRDSKDKELVDLWKELNLDQTESDQEIGIDFFLKYHDGSIKAAQVKFRGSDGIIKKDIDSFTGQMNYYKRICAKKSNQVYPHQTEKVNEWIIFTNCHRISDNIRCSHSYPDLSFIDGNDFDLLPSLL